MAESGDSEVLQRVRCCGCGIVFAMPEALYRIRLDDRRPFWCPNGHGQNFTAETPADKLVKAQQAHAALQKEREFWEAEAQRRLDECDRLRARLGESAVGARAWLQRWTR